MLIQINDIDLDKKNDLKYMTTNMADKVYFKKLMQMMLGKCWDYRLSSEHLKMEKEEKLSMIPMTSEHLKREHFD